jgi:ABC-type Mn2+/Zn2+ transport system ATPase subunit
MTALSAFRTKAAEKHVAFPIDLDEGETVTLKSILMLDEVELKLFNESTKRLAAMDEDESDLEELREEFISTLSGVSSDKAKLAQALAKEPLGVLTVIFEDYAGALSDGTKSKDAV